jgi:hypothetical protein
MQVATEAPAAAVLERLPLLVIALGALLRLPGLFDDFWFDEIWAWKLGMRLSPAQIPFVGLSANHHLYTLLLHVLGPQPWPVYRLPSYVASVLSLVLLVPISAGFGRGARVCMLALFAASHLMVHYASEARGYALAMMFALAAVLGALRYAAGGGLRWALLIWVAIALGLASHLLFVHALGGLGAYFVVRMVLGAGDRVDRMRRAFVALGAPSLLFLAVYWWIIRSYSLGTGGGADVRAVVLETLSRTLGGPSLPAASYGFAVIAIVLLLALCVRLWRIDPPFAAMVATAGVLSPCVMLLANPTEWLFPRYFLLSLTFLLLGAGRVLGALFDAGGRARHAVVALLVLYAVGHGAHLEQQLREGRGHYAEALIHMLGASHAPIVTLASPQPKWTTFALDFYLPLLDPQRRIRFVPAAQLSRAPAEWLVVQEVAIETHPPARLEVYGHLYALDRTYRYGTLSGFHWTLYRRMSSS